MVEIPALLNWSDAMVTHTADSVNMLALRTGDHSARCIIPKPFGPVCGDQYIFESYITSAVADQMGLQINFVNNWDYLHIHHEEIHCGTNQVPRLLPDQRAWWLHAPP